MKNEIIGYTESGKVKFLCCKYRPYTNRPTRQMKKGVCDTDMSSCPLGKAKLNRRCKGKAKMLWNAFLIWNQEVSDGKSRHISRWKLNY